MNQERSSLYAQYFLACLVACDWLQRSKTELRGDRYSKAIMKELFIFS